LRSRLIAQLSRDCHRQLPAHTPALNPDISPSSPPAPVRNGRKSVTIIDSLNLSEAKKIYRYLRDVRGVEIKSVKKPKQAKQEAEEPAQAADKASAGEQNSATDDADVADLKPASADSKAPAGADQKAPAADPNLIVAGERLNSAIKNVLNCGGTKNAIIHPDDHTKLIVQITGDKRDELRSLMIAAGIDKNRIKVCTQRMTTGGLSLLSQCRRFYFGRPFYSVQCVLTKVSCFSKLLWLPIRFESRLLAGGWESLALIFFYGPLFCATLDCSWIWLLREGRDFTLLPSKLGRITVFVLSVICLVSLLA